MIYQIYGFNMVCEHYIEALEEYNREEYDNALPTVFVSAVNRLDEDAINGAKISGDYADAVFTNHVCCFHLVDGSKIRISFIIFVTRWITGRIFEKYLKKGA